MTAPASTPSVEPAPTVEIAVGLGSNLGTRLRYMRTGIAAIAALGRIVDVSSLYETAPVGGPPQGPFLNAVAVAVTDRPASWWLERLLAAEEAAGRSRTVRYGPRTLDLDVLLYGDERIDFPELQVPHPRLTERRFVLEPLVEIRPRTAVDGVLLADRLPELALQDVARIRDPGWVEVG